MKLFKWYVFYKGFLLSEVIDAYWWHLRGWYVIKKLRFSCWLWDLRGLKACPEHGFHAQSWINGKCRKCEK